jgi:hypothetical protein
MKLKFNFRLPEKKLVPLEKFKELVNEVRELGLPQYRKDNPVALCTSKIFGLFLSLLLTTA